MKMIITDMVMKSNRGTLLILRREVIYTRTLLGFIVAVLGFSSAVFIVLLENTIN